MDKLLEWLLEEENASVRFRMMTELLKKPEDDPEVIETKKLIMKTGAVPEILSKQNDDGSWGAPERFYRDKYRGTVWNLLILAELNADSDDIRIKNACEFILNHSQEREYGGFSYDESMKSGGGLLSGVIPCLTGNMVYSLIKLGYFDDFRVQKGIEWITDYQRADDGAEHAPKGKFYERYEMCWGKHTCHMGAAKALKALAAVPENKRTEKINNKIGEISEYFLKHHIYKKSHDISKIARPGWLKLGFPLMYQTDILELSEILAGLKLKDGRMDDALETIRKKQMNDGRWKLENSFNGKLTVDIEKKGMPSKWITLKALKALEIYR